MGHRWSKSSSASPSKASKTSPAAGGEASGTSSAPSASKRPVSGEPAAAASSASPDGTAAPAKSASSAGAAAAAAPSGEEKYDEMLYSANTSKVTANDFQLLKVIGKGSFGKVMQVKKKDTGKIYAMKVLSKQVIISRNQVVHTRSEKNILQMVQHPFIVTLHFAFQTPHKLYMILDYVNGGELFFHLKKEGKFSESRVKFYAAEITLALHHLHSLDIVYRDLKPENILLDSDGHIVITDFGLSKQIADPGGTHTFCGTPEYLAPEVLRGLGHGTPVDWWSLGTLVYEMLTGLPPFYSANTNVMYQKILTGELRFPPDISPDCRSFLEGLLERDASRRLTGDEVRSHRWMASIDWEKLYRKEIPTPWKPPVANEADTTQIDPSFIVEPVKDSPPEAGPLGAATAGGAAKKDDQFVGFTFVGASELAPKP